MHGIGWREPPRPLFLEQVTAARWASEKKRSTSKEEKEEGTKAGKDSREKKRGEADERGGEGRREHKGPHEQGNELVELQR